jgi:4-amino-4-deoxy-L-arabinose transferase-like glycosyltransferase
MRRTRFWSLLAVILLAAAAVRALYPLADPPWRAAVGVVWHDEGAWTHNARNKALFGAWRQDEWNPVYIAPVFTALEYESFALLGVGLRQARLVSEAAGVVSVLLLALGLRRLRGANAALIGGALAATNYVYVMYDRAAIMEALMAAFVVASWYCSIRAERGARWGAIAGVLATLAFFTKAAAAFYVGALGLVALLRILSRDDGHDGNSRRAAAWTLVGLAIAFVLIGALFVFPHWSDYRFYNWQMSVTRKPSYDMASILQRIVWFPVLHDTFSRSWPELLLAVVGAWAIAGRWRTASDGERLLLLWVAAGSLELLIHDVGNERRFVFLLPALAAFSAVALESRAIELQSPRGFWQWAAVPLIFYCWYIVAAPIVRMLFLEEVRAHVLHTTVRVSAIAALAGGGVTMFALRRTGLVSLVVRRFAAVLTLVLLLGWDIYQFVDYARGRTYKNYEAMIALGRAVAPETMIQGKLANGLDLENRIRPIFIGHAFGNYADRFTRDDVRYILTYTVPKLGYEGSQIEDVLAASPGRRIIMTFDVAESPGGHDKAALFEKRARN